MRVKRNRLARLAFLPVIALAIFLQGCVSRNPQSTPFEETIATDQYLAWSAKHNEEIVEYREFLDKEGVRDVVPMSQLLKSARDWQRCDAERYTMPPKELWPNIVPTLQVIKKFKAQGVLINPVAASVYRDPVLNACAGGSLKSKHLQLNAIDFDINVTPDSLKTLCDAWKTLGPELKLGLGFYTPSRIHLDTQGFRSWGADHTHKSSLCLLIAPPAVSMQ